MKAQFARFAAQFRDLDPNDPGLWPLAPQVTVWVVAFVLALFLGWYLLWSDQIAAIEAAVAKEPELKERWLAKKRLAVNLPLLRNQVKAAEKQFGDLLQRLPSRAEVDGLLKEAHRYGLQRGLRFELFRPGTESVKEFYAELPVTIRLTGDYHRIAGFLSDVSSMPRVVSFADVKLAVANRQGDNPTLQMDATLFAYRYLDEEERAAQVPKPAQRQGGQR